MNRRSLLAAGFALLAAPVGVRGQDPKLRRIGILSLAGGRSEFWQVFEQALHERGWMEGKNLAFSFRFAAGKTDQVPALAAELVRLPVDVLVADLGTTLTAARSTTRIPIVMRFGLDAVEAGVVGPLGRPARNVTGLTGDATGEVMGKRLELLRAVAPSARRVAVLTLRFPGIESWQRDLERAARVLAFTVHVVPIRNAQGLQAAFESIRAAADDSLFCGGDPVTFFQRPRITDFALRERLPAVYGPAEWAEDGGLVSYGVNIAELYRECADYVDRLLRGAMPAELPVRRPGKYELAVNLRTAKALGITVPPSVLVRADRVIE